MAKPLAESAVLSRCCVRRSLSSWKPPSAVSIVRSPAEAELLGSSAKDCSFNEGGLAVGGRRKMLSKRHLPSIPSQKTDFCEKISKWWELGLQPNMMQIGSAQDLVDSLLNAENKLVVVDFFNPACRSCRALHPKICQAAEKNPDSLFLQINHEKLKLMCYALNVHVLPFFRFYRGAHGRLCNFSCTIATIKKFKDALAKHTTDRCSLGPARGLEESELLALAAKDLTLNYTQENPSLVPVPEKSTALVSATSR